MGFEHPSDSDIDGRHLNQRLPLPHVRRRPGESEKSTQGANLVSGLRIAGDQLSQIILAGGFVAPGAQRR